MKKIEKRVLEILESAQKFIINPEQELANELRQRGSVIVGGSSGATFDLGERDIKVSDELEMKIRTIKYRKERYLEYEKCIKTVNDLIQHYRSIKELEKE